MLIQLPAGRRSSSACGRAEAPIAPANNLKAPAAKLSGWLRRRDWGRWPVVISSQRCFTLIMVVLPFAAGVPRLFLPTMAPFEL
jgi:hypothetical protein